MASHGDRPEPETQAARALAAALPNLCHPGVAQNLALLAEHRETVRAAFARIGAA